MTTPSPDLALLAADLFRLAMDARRPNSGFTFADEMDLHAAWSLLRGVRSRQALRNPHETPSPQVTR